MPSKTFPKLLANAQDLRVLCQTTPSMNHYQPLATSAVEPMVPINEDPRKRVASLLMYAVKRMAASHPLSPEVQSYLDAFERFKPLISPAVLELSLYVKDFGYARKLEETRYTLLRVTNQVTKSKELEPRARDSDAKQTIIHNRTAALTLARHVQNATAFVVKRAATLHADMHGECWGALTALCLTLDAFLNSSKHRRVAISWLSAGNDKDRFSVLNGRLDKALAVFSIVHNNTHKLSILVTTKHHVEDDARRTITVK
ncbi:hypothetical protein B0H19DRAFT_1069748 [Mycena capillaripes]|nr:hypothetical protein B0H19DRAFT_1069748 [Mycena capillaripes]